MKAISVWLANTYRYVCMHACNSLLQLKLISLPIWGISSDHHHYWNNIQWRNITNSHSRIVVQQIPMWIGIYFSACHHFVMFYCCCTELNAKNTRICLQHKYVHIKCLTRCSPLIPFSLFAAFIPHWAYTEHIFKIFVYIPISAFIPSLSFISFN